MADFTRDLVEPDPVVISAPVRVSLNAAQTFKSTAGLQYICCILQYLANVYRTFAGWMANIHEEEALGKAYDSRLMQRLPTYLRPYKWQWQSR